MLENELYSENSAYMFFVNLLYAVSCWKTCAEGLYGKPALELSGSIERETNAKMIF